MPRPSRSTCPARAAPRLIAAQGHRRGAFPDSPRPPPRRPPTPPPARAGSLSVALRKRHSSPPPIDPAAAAGAARAALKAAERWCPALPITGAATSAVEASQSRARDPGFAHGSLFWARLFCYGLLQATQASEPQAWACLTAASTLSPVPHSTANRAASRPARTVRRRKGLGDGRKKAADERSRDRLSTARE